MPDLDDMPNRRYSLRGIKLSNGMQVYAIHEIARKIYRCPGCNQLIDIGSEHTVIRYIDGSWQGSNHHHYHRDCAQAKIIDRLSALEKIDSVQSIQSVLTKKNRRKRARRRK